MDDVWGSEKSQSLWNAKLFAVGETPEDSAGHSVQVLDSMVNPND